MKFLRTNLLTLTLFIIILFFLLFEFVFSAKKISYVDSGKLLNGYNAMVHARTEFESKKKTWEANIDSLTREVQESMVKYEKTAVSGSEKERQLSRELISNKQKQLYDYQNAINQNAAQEEQRLTQSVLTTVNNYLLRYGKKHGYKMILVATNGNIAYADPSMDITDKIVEQLNKEYTVTAK